MSLALYYHPLSSFCWKVLIALYEADVAFTPILLNDLTDPAQRAEFQKVWPLGKFPVLVDGARGRTVPESSIIVDYLAQHYPAARGLIPTDPDRARQALLLDRLFDDYIHVRFQQIVVERFRPDDQRDPFGVALNQDAIRAGYDAVAPMVEGPWALGEDFTIADCAALPALFYGDYGVSLDGWPTLRAYLDRLKARPTVARVIEEAQPYFHLFPLKDG